MPGTTRHENYMPELNMSSEKLGESAGGRKFIIEIHDRLTVDAKKLHGPENLRRLFSELTRYLHNNFIINGVISDDAYIEVNKIILPQIFIIINDTVLQDFVASGGFHIVTAQVLDQTVDGKERENWNGEVE